MQVRFPWAAGMMGLGLLLVPGGAEATSASVRLTMPIIAVDLCCDPSVAGVPLGDRVSVTYVFETGTPDAYPDAKFGGFDGALESLTLFFPDVGLTFATIGGVENVVQTSNDSGCERLFPNCMTFGWSDQIFLWLKGGGTGDRVEGKRVESISVVLGDTEPISHPGPTMMVDDRLPMEPFRFDVGQIGFGNSRLSYQVWVPEPSTSLTGLSALAAIIARVRRMADISRQPTYPREAVRRCPR